MRMDTDPLVQTKGVYGILVSLYTNGELPMTHLQSDIPNYQRVVQVVDMLHTEGLVDLKQGSKKHIKIVSLTLKGKKYTEHIIDAEKLRERRAEEKK